MGKSAFERDPILVAPAIISQHHGKAPVLPQKNSVGTCHTGANINDSLAGALFFGVVPAIHLHAAEALLGLGVGRRQRHILLIARDPFRELGDFLRVFPIHQFLQSVHLVQVAGFQHIEPRHLHIQVALLDNKWVAGGQCLDFRIAEGSFIYIIRHTDGGLAGHDLGDELLLVLHKLVEVSVKSAFRYIPIDFHLLIFIALADDTPQPLLKVGRPPGAVQVMQGNELILDVSACAHFGRGTQQHPHLPGAHLGKQLLLFGFAVCRVDKGDFFFRDTGVHQFLF